MTLRTAWGEAPVVGVVPVTPPALPSPSEGCREVQLEVDQVLQLDEEQRQEQVERARVVLQRVLEQPVQLHWR